MNKLLDIIDQSFFFKSFTRKSLDKFLPKIILSNLHGDVLEVGGLHSPYIDIYAGHTSYTTLDIEKSSKADIIADIHQSNIPQNSYDTIIATEVLEHLYNPHLAVREIYNILKTDGTFIGSTRFIYPYHGVPHDYFRFTKYGLENIFSMFKKVEIISIGNSTHGILDLISRGSRIGKLFAPIFSIFGFFFPPKINNTKNPLGFIIVAQK